MLDAAPLARAEASGDGAAIDSTATDLALRLARMHLLGFAPAAQRAGWRISDSDGAVDLHGQLERAVSLDMIDSFFAGLGPTHPDYAVLRAAYAAPADPPSRLRIARNMERWRWMPRSLGPDYVLVNAAAFEAELWRQGRLVGTWPVIVGKRSTPTPVFSAMITGVILNPWWTVPESIIREKHGNFPARQGYVRSGGQVRQKPGPDNALGAMKLDMPNPFTVYMHDTPSKHLFAREVRAFSHGCIRVGNALDFAGTLLEGIKTRDDIQAIVATRNTITIRLPADLPVYVAYFTAGADGRGKLALYPDIYNRDGRVGDATVPSDGCSA
ncbi:L,D-transpeptidase catalytic domain [Novosphingobium sp. CF614]|nr:L,D-transpeptidase catalytic domain [Novosphingobium sp. CF614]